MLTNNYLEYLKKIQAEEMRDLRSPYRLVKTEAQRLKRLETWQRLAEAS